MEFIEEFIGFYMRKGFWVVDRVCRYSASMVGAVSEQDSLLYDMLGCRSDSNCLTGNLILA